MQKDLISTKQAICIFVLFAIGSSLNIGINATCKQDSWIAILIGLFLSIPMIMAFARILNLYPGQNLFDIIIDVFGRTLGKIIIFFYVLYFISVGALIMENYADFVQVVAMPETPQLVILIFMLSLCVWMLKSGIGTFGRWSKIILPIVIVAILAISLLSIKFMDFKNIKPILGTDFSTLMGSSFSVFSLPFTETIIFAFLFSSVKSPNNPYKIYIVGISISTIILLISILRNIFVLGNPSLIMYYFPSYAAVSIVSLGDFFTRIEVLVGMMFLFSGFAKICVCMFASSLGVAKLINIQNVKNLAVPIGLLMLTLASILFSNTIEMYNWLANVFKFYALPFQVILPLLILVGAEIKIRIRKFTSNGNIQA